MHGQDGASSEMKRQRDGKREEWGNSAEAREGGSEEGGGDSAHRHMRHPISRADSDEPAGYATHWTDSDTDCPGTDQTDSDTGCLGVHRTDSDTSV